MTIYRGLLSREKLNTTKEVTQRKTPFQRTAIHQAPHGKENGEKMTLQRKENQPQYQQNFSQVPLQQTTGTVQFSRKQWLKDQQQKKQQPKKQQPKNEPSTGKSTGKAKWGTYAEGLAWKGVTQFVQYVPEGADTIQAALVSQDITDAVYHDNKAFWVSDPANYELKGSEKLAQMIYTFSGTGAKSMWEDNLICGSGDFADDNPEPWKGETKHPDYTIWKTSEMGARGIGANRLSALRGSVTKIEAKDKARKLIKPKKN